MDIHHRAGKRAVPVQVIPQIEIVVVFQTHSAKHDHIDFGLERDTGKQLVVRLSRNGKDGKLLGNDQRVENVNHRNTGANHLFRNDTLRRVHRRTSDRHGIFLDDRTVVTRISGTVKDSAQERIAERNLHRMPKETYLGIRRNASRTGKDLQIDLFAVYSDHAG